MRDSYSVKFSGFKLVNSKIFKRNYSDLCQSLKLHPYYVTGFCDGESSFIISIRPNSKIKTGWSVELIFEICLHKKDLELLKLIQQALGGVGNISKHSDKSIQLKVGSVKDLELIVNHFDKYPLITQKCADYFLFKQALELVKNKKHLTLEGIQNLINIKASVNLGLSDKLKVAFPNTVPVSRPLINEEIKDSNWLSGFISAEGCFLIVINPSKSNKIGSVVSLWFQITQHSRDEKLLKSFISYLGCGRYTPHSNRNAGNFIVQKFSDLDEKIIPFLKKYSILGIKALDFSDFCEVGELIKNKAHLTTTGLEQILTIKKRMNNNRIN
uniref:hypothetical protein n=1 Tax=Drechslerella dactyloides TaxID=74499 RepID=UPI0022FD462D|nr:hypothetical protein PNX16_mgp029 [Drechslerella dactyloides]WAN89822.1 hypothetical protein [Drechslerella dactyloides]